MTRTPSSNSQTGCVLDRPQPLRPRLPLWVVACFLLSVGGVDCLAATYHVSPSGNDANSGTSLGTAWATFTKANSTLAAGDMVLIHAGTYPGQWIYPTNSGSPGNYITYKGAPGESMPVITAPPSYHPPSSAYSFKMAIVLDGNHHIWIEGLKFSGGSARPPEGTGANIHMWAGMYDADYNVVKSNYFEYAHGYNCFAVFDGCQFNQILNNTLRVGGTYDNGNTTVAGDVFYLATGADENLVEGNDMRYGGHNVISVRGARNLIRSNFFDNNWGELPGTSNDGVGFRVGSLTTGIATVGEAAGVGYNLFENNIVTGTRQSYLSELDPALADSHTFKIEGPGQIVRANFFVDNEFGVWTTVIRDNGVPLTTGVHIYNNTLHGNGGDSWWMRNYANDPVRLNGNVVMNNLMFQNRQNGNYAVGTQDADVIMISDTLGSGLLASNRFFNNAVFNAGPNDGKVYLQGAAFDSLAYFESNYGGNFHANLQLNPLLAISPVPPYDVPTARAQFDLQANSPMIDAGAHLTRTVAASGSGNVVTVEDAGYFYPGISEIGVPGDLVRVGANPPVQVTAVDYANNILTLASAVSWTGGAVFVDLDYNGTSPDVGAREFAGTAPLAPGNLTVSLISSNQIDLSWTDNSTNETQFRIERKIEAGGYAFLADAVAVGGSGGVGTYSDTNLNPNTTYTYRVRAEGLGGTSDWSNEATTNTPSGAPAGTFLMSSNQVVMEAEHATSRANGAQGHYWGDVTETNASGGATNNAIQALPDSGLGLAVPGADSCRADYLIEVPEGSAASYYIHVRARADGNTNDSVYVSINSDTNSYKQINLPIHPTAFGWATHSGTLDIPSGLQALTLWMREDGAVVDKLVVSTSNTLPTGLGPDESPRSSGSIQPLEFLTPVLNGGQLMLDWTGNGQLEEADTVLGPWTPVPAATNPPSMAPVMPGENRFFRLVH